MNMSIIQKSWLSPFLAVSFLMVAATGIVLLFHVRIFPVMVLHEFMSVLFCIAGLLHTWANVKPLIGYFRQRKAFISLAIGVLLGSLFIAMALGHASEHDEERRCIHAER
jgi:uncharacterized membrane protein YraQ (UPF0718 family)